MNVKEQPQYSAPATQMSTDTMDMIIHLLMSHSITSASGLLVTQISARRSDPSEDMRRRDTDNALQRDYNTGTPNNNTTVITGTVTIN